MPKIVLCYDDHFSRYGKLNIFRCPGRQDFPWPYCRSLLSQCLWFISYGFFVRRLIIHRKLNVAQTRMVLKI